MKEYTILFSYSSSSLADEVNQYLQQGWDLHEGVFHKEDQFFQALTRTIPGSEKRGKAVLTRSLSPGARG